MNVELTRLSGIKHIALHLLLICSVQTFAQDKPVKDKVPKQYSLEAGYRNMHTSTLHSSTRNGFFWMFDYAWQLSGMRGEKKKAFLTVPIGMQYYYGNTAQDTSMRIICYGWTVRHEMAKDKKMTPFIGYSLFLNNMKREGVPGGIMGHQTKFEAGLNISHGKRLKTFFNIEYCYTRFPQYNNKKSIHLSALGINIGVRY